MYELIHRKTRTSLGVFNSLKEADEFHDSWLDSVNPSGSPDFDGEFSVDFIKL